MRLAFRKGKSSMILEGDPPQLERDADVDARIRKPQFAYYAGPLTEEAARFTRGGRVAFSDLPCGCRLELDCYLSMGSRL